MKNSKVKKLIAAVLSLVMCVSILSFSACAATKPEGDIITPQNIAILGTDNLLELGSLGKLTIVGSNDVRDGYKAKVIVELQRYDDGWKTIKTWSDYDDACALVETAYYVTSGYYYRLKLTHQAYTMSDSLVETIYKYSDIINYNVPTN